MKDRHAKWREAGATFDAEPVEHDVEGEEDEEDEARRRRDALAREESEDIE